jgi:PEP-CTERM motif
MYYWNQGRPRDVRGSRLRLKAGAALIFLVGFAAIAQAAPTTLTDRNSSAGIDPSAQAGMFNWTVNSINQLAQQWFWYRIGPTGPESSIDTLSLFSNTATDTNGNGLNDTLSLSYGNGATPAASSFLLDVTYSLQGTRAAGSSIGETINIKNNTSSPLDFHFFQYSHFTLGGVAGGETEALLNPNTVRVLGTGNLFSETVVTRAPNHYELAFNPTTINRLNDASATQLSDGPTTAGPGDVTWAFEWDQTLNPTGQAGDTLTISKDKTLQLVPEPGTLALMATGLVGGFVFFRKRANRRI